MAEKWFPSEEGSQGIGGINPGVWGYFRGRVGYYLVVGDTQATVEAWALGQWQKSYDRWMRGRLEVNGAVVWSGETRMTSLYASWHEWLNSGLRTVTIARTATDQTILIKAVFEIGTPYQSPTYDRAFESTYTLVVPARVVVPTAPGTPVATRASDNRNDVAWTRSVTAYGAYQSQRVSRRIDNGGWADLVNVPGTATSYIDTGTQANHYYAYRVVAQNSAGSATSGTSNTVYNTPAAPGTPTGARVSDTQIRLTFANPGITQTATEYQRSADGAAWSASVTVSGQGIVQIVDLPGSSPSGAWHYRVRNARMSPTALYSAWSQASEGVVVETPPAAPTLLSPANGAVVSMAGSLHFAWQHNPRDGSAQTAWDLRYSTDNGATWAVVSSSPGVNGTDQHLDVFPVSLWDVNATVLWQARTRGVHAGYSEYASAHGFTVRQVPQASITSPLSGSVITDMPLDISWSYSDVSGSQQLAWLEITDSEGQAVWSKALSGAATSYLLGADEFLLTNMQSYTLTVEVTSTSTLSAQTSSAFAADYVEPAAPELALEADTRLALVNAVLFAGAAGPSQPQAMSLGLYRRNPDGTVVSLGQGLANGASVIDRFVPTSIGIDYIAVAMTATGVSSQTVKQAYVESFGADIWNFGEGYEQVAKLVANPSQSRSVAFDTHYFFTAGEEDPLVFYGTNVTYKGSRSGTVKRHEGIWPDADDPSSLDDIERLAWARGDTVMRLPGKRAFLADVTVSITDPLQSTADVTVSFQKVREHDELAI